MSYSGTDQASSLVAAVTDLLRLADGGAPPNRVLRKLCQVSRDVVSADAATVMVADDSRLRFAHASPAAFAEMGKVQEQLQLGPCRVSLDEQRVVAAAAAELERWPEMAAAAASLGVSSVLSVPLVSRGRARGVLDLYGSTQGHWTRTQTQTATLLGRVVANYMATAADRQSAWMERTQLEHRATHDALTNLPNRALLFDRLEHAVLGAARYKHSLAVLFVDLDHFKLVNDTFGHAAGDAALVDIAQRLTEIVRHSDTLARLSGDEFIVVCEHVPGSRSTIIRQLLDLARRIHTALDQPLDLDGITRMTASIGVAVASGTSTGTSGKQLLAAADDAMYEAKRAGRAQTRIRCDW